MQRYFAIDKKDNLFILSTDDLWHIKKVMRMKDEASIEVVFDKKLYICSIHYEKENIVVSFIKEIIEKNTLNSNINIVIPLLKEQKMDFVLQKLAELGASHITLIETERSVVKIPSDKFEKKYERWNKILKEASEQSKRTTIPILSEIKKIDYLAGMNGINIVCSTIEKNNTIKKVFQNYKNYDTINVVIGPEGGLSLKEENYLNEIGFKSVTLGSNILRVETVPIYILSIINYIYME